MCEDICFGKFDHFYHFDLSTGGKEELWKANSKVLSITGALLEYEDKVNW